MDGRFLSDPDVVAASRRLVCVRLATYESAEEVEVLRTIFVGRSGEVENTTFAVLAPDARTPLVRAGRSPDRAFRDAQDLAAFLEEAAARYAPREAPLPLPLAASARLGLNVAACDGLPLVLLRARSADAQAALAARLAPLHWARLAGRAVWAGATSSDDVAALDGEGEPDAVLVVAPDAFGQAGRVVERLPATLDDEALAHVLALEGRARGVVWKPAVPVTDPYGKPGSPPPGGGPPRGR